jgi:hypothetical protein
MNFGGSEMYMNLTQDIESSDGSGLEPFNREQASLVCYGYRLVPLYAIM